MLPFCLIATELLQEELSLPESDQHSLTDTYLFEDGLVLVPSEGHATPAPQSFFSPVPAVRLGLAAFSLAVASVKALFWSANRSFSLSRRRRHRPIEMSPRRLC